MPWLHRMAFCLLDRDYRLRFHIVAVSVLDLFLVPESHWNMFPTLNKISKDYHQVAPICKAFCNTSTNRSIKNFAKVATNVVCILTNNETYLILHESVVNWSLKDLCTVTRKKMKEFKAYFWYLKNNISRIVLPYGVVDVLLSLPERSSLNHC